MQTSACVTVATRADTGLRRRQRGFTLLEILIVVVLMVGISTLLVVAALRMGADNPLVKAESELADVVVMLNERSLFSGELLALRFSPRGWEPLRFDVTEGRFLPLPAPFRITELEPSLSLDWQLDEGGDRDQPAIAEAAAVLFADKDENGDKDIPPQMFFFPSGEVSPLTLWLSEEGSDPREIRIDPLGRVQRPAEEDEGAA